MAYQPIEYGNVYAATFTLYMYCGVWATSGGPSFLVFDGGDGFPVVINDEAEVSTMLERIRVGDLKFVGNVSRAFIAMEYKHTERY